MYHVNARNVQEALPKAINILLQEGNLRSSRNGDVLSLPFPLVTTIHRPTERVLISKERAANPAFHLLESIWMLAGRNDTKFPATIVKQIKKYSDTGDTLHGAYGHRWRQWFGYDQLAAILVELTQNPNSRRCVLQMWDGGRDMAMATIANGKDVPCNTAIYFDRRNGRLNMTVSNRSNDIIWGLYGANAVHMSILQEYVASALGIGVGWMTTLSNDAHAYLEQYPSEKLAAISTSARNESLWYEGRAPQPMLLPGETIHELDADIRTFFELFDSGRQGKIGEVAFLTDWFRSTVVRMWLAWYHRNDVDGVMWAARIADPLWSTAMRDWLAQFGKVRA